MAVTALIAVFTLHFATINTFFLVLIVAKCNVNKEKNILHFKIDGGINSSKV